MFKKPFKTQQQSLLKSSDKRKLRDNIHRNFPEVPEDQLNIILPVKVIISLFLIYIRLFSLFKN